MLQLLKVRIYLIPSALQTPSEQLQLEKTLRFAPRSTLSGCPSPSASFLGAEEPMEPHQPALTQLRVRISGQREALGLNLLLART